MTAQGKLRRKVRNTTIKAYRRMRAVGYSVGYATVICKMQLQASGLYSRKHEVLQA